MIRFLGGVLIGIGGVGAVLAVLAMIFTPEPRAPQLPAPKAPEPQTGAATAAPTNELGIVLDIPSDWVTIPETDWASFLAPFPLANPAIATTRVVLADKPAPEDADAVLMVMSVSTTGGSLDFVRSLGDVPGGTLPSTPPQAIRLNGLDGAVVARSNTVEMFGRPVDATIRLVALDLPTHGLYLFSYSADGTPAATRLRAMTATIRPAL